MKLHGKNQHLVGKYTGQSPLVEFLQCNRSDTTGGLQLIKEFFFNFRVNTIHIQEELMSTLKLKNKLFNLQQSATSSDTIPLVLLETQKWLLTIHS